MTLFGFVMIYCTWCRMFSFLYSPIHILLSARKMYNYRVVPSVLFAPFSFICTFIPFASGCGEIRKKRSKGKRVKGVSFGRKKRETDGSQEIMMGYGSPVFLLGLVENFYSWSEGWTDTRLVFFVLVFFVQSFSSKTTSPWNYRLMEILPNHFGQYSGNFRPIILP